MPRKSWPKFFFEENSPPFSSNSIFEFGGMSQYFFCFVVTSHHKKVLSHAVQIMRFETDFLKANSVFYQLSWG